MPVPKKRKQPKEQATPPAEDFLFPRGGASLLTPLEYKDLTLKADRDVLFDDDSNPAKDEPATKKRKSAKSTKLGKTSNSCGDPDVKEKKSFHIDTLKFKRLAVGNTLLGCISYINDLDLVVSLPYHLTGSVSITEISEPLSKAVESVAATVDDEGDDALPDLRSLFRVGQWVRCVIIELDVGDKTETKDKNAKPRKRIELSLKPELVNTTVVGNDLSVGMTLTAAVQSVEDHGYILSLGIDSVSGFLHNKEAKTYVSRRNDGRTLVPGQLVECAIISIAENRRVAKMTADPDTVAKVMLDAPVSTVASLLPGTLVHPLITDIHSTGLSLKFMGFFEGTADLVHSDVYLSSDLEKTYTVGQKCKARIVALSLSSTPKRIYLSLAKHVVALGQPAVKMVEDEKNDEQMEGGDVQESAARFLGERWPVGTFLEVVVRRVDPTTGLFCEVKGVDGIGAYVHIFRISDEHLHSLSATTGAYKIGTLHRARVIGYDAVDGILQLSLQPSVLDQQFLRIEDVKVGEVVKCTFEKLIAGGAMVTLSDGIRAVALTQHLSDVRLTHPEKKFKPGQQVTARVLTVDLQTRRMLVTLKRTLVQSDLDIVTRYEDAVPGMTTHGVITAVKAFGCIVTFYGAVKALAPITELSESFIKDPTTTFQIGQVVKCRILTVDSSKSRLHVSFKSSAYADSHPQTKDLTTIQPGQLVPGKIISLLTDIIVVALQPSQIWATLPLAHLSDHLGPAHIQKLYDRLKEGQVLDDLVVLSKNEQRKSVLVSCKPVLVKAAKERKYPSVLEHVEAGKLMPGYVKSVTDLGVFVGFGGELTGLALRHNISDELIISPASLFHPNQTVLCLATSVDHDTGKLNLSLKPSLTPISEVDYLDDGEFVRSYFEELAFATQQQPVRVGECVKATIKQVLSYGWIVELESGVSGFVTVEQSKDVKEGCEGTTLVGKVLDVDADKNIVDLTARADLISEEENNAALKAGAESDTGTGKKKKPLGVVNDKNLKKLESLLKDKTVVDVTIELVKEDYLVVSLPHYHNQIAFAATKTFNNRSKPFMRYKPGQKIKARLTYFPKGVVSRLDRVLVTLQSQEDVQRQNRLVRNPVDESITSFDDYLPGRLTRCVVRHVKRLQINVRLAEDVKGRIHVSEVADRYSDIQDKQHTLKAFRTGQNIDVKVIGYHHIKSHKYLPITHRTAKTVIELTMKPSEMAVEGRVIGEDALSLVAFQIGQTVTAYVSKVLADCVWVNVSSNVRGKVEILQVSNDLEILENLDKHFFIGQAVQCVVIGKDLDKLILDLSIKSANLSASITDFESVKEGMVVVGSVVKVEPKLGMILQLAEGIHGRVHLTDLADTFVDEPTQPFIKGQIVKCCVIGVNAQNKRIDLSLRQSRTGGTIGKKGDDKENMDAELKAIEDLHVGQIVRGYVVNVASEGLFVSVSKNLTARVKIAELSDDYLKDWKGAFEIGQLVSGKVLSLDPSTNQIELSLKASSIDPNVQPNLTLSDFTKGQKVKGSINRVETYGVLIKIDKSNVRGLCHSSEISDTLIKDVSKIYTVGDPVKAVVLNIDMEKRRISFGLKSSYFEDGDAEDESNEGEPMEEVENDEDDNEDMVEAGYDEETDEEANSKMMKHLASILGQENDEEQDEENEYDDAYKVVANDIAPLPITSRFNWDGDVEMDKSTIQPDSESETSEDDTAHLSKKKSKKRKNATEVEDRTADLATQAPQVAADYERLLLGSPNSSYLWINYMAFQLQLSEITKAREIGERALKIISFREEQEKMNVWVAMMNLENTFGTGDSLDAVFKRALQFCEPKKVYLQLVKIYERSKKINEAEELYKTIVKKFGQSSKVWTIFGLFYLKHGNVEGARDLLQRSLKVLSKRKHIKTITKFAQMEFKYGEPERGRTIFEGIMSNYPKRVDLWSVYLDMETRAGDQDIVRRLFQRVTVMKFSSKKMKFFFKKWLSYEKEQGSEEHVEDVKRRALAYVESLNA